MKECKVALAQIDLKLGDKKVNLKKTSAMALKAAKLEADVLCLPEYLSTGSILEQCKKLAEPIPGYTVNKLKIIAQENGIHLVASLLENDDDTIFNTAVLIDSKGELLTKYRKIHLFMDEKKYITHGQDHVVVDTTFGKVGLMICYDAVFPEVARRLALQGARIIFMPANWPNPFLPQWKLATSARALDNQVWLVASNRIGADNRFSYFGKSRIVNPYGDAVIECNDKEAVRVATVEEKTTEEFKNIVHFLKDRQPKVYTKR